MSRLPTLSLPHGGGPWNVMKNAFGDPAPFEELAAWLVAVGKRYRGRAKALLVISAHWEQRQPTVHFGKAPGMLYDYGGFPDFTYQLKWPAPGAPEVAARVEELLKGAGFTPGREEDRGYDHGTFVPLMVAYPEADLPVAQLSLVSSLDPATHVALGKALTPLRDEGVLILASGMSYHNMNGFMTGDPQVAKTARGFDAWLNQTIALSDSEERNRRLIAWESAPGARECHPRSEHLIPLFVAAGAAGADLGRTDHSQDLMGVPISGHIFGE